MGQTPKEVLDIWIEAAASGTAISKQEYQRIITAGEFLWKTCRAKLDEVSNYLRGIDYRKEVKVLRGLPDRLYVQYVFKHRGHWFTNTGVSAEACGLDPVFAEKYRRRDLFRPAGSDVAALRTTARSIRDWWSISKIIDWPTLERERSPADVRQLKSKIGTWVRGGGEQYFVAEPTRRMQLLDRGKVGI